MGLHNIETFINQRTSGNADTEAAYNRSRTANDSHSRTANDSHSRTANDSHSRTANDSHSRTVNDSHSRTANDSHSRTANDSHSRTVNDSHSRTANDSHSRTADDSRSATTQRQAYITAIVLLAGIAMSILGVPLHLTGIVGIQAWPLLLVSWIWFAVAIATLLLFVYSHISIDRLLCAFNMAVQAITTVRIILLALHPYPGDQLMMLVNMTISLVVELILALGLQVKAPLATTAISIAGMTAAWLISPQQAHGALVLTYSFMQVMVAVYCLVASRLLKDAQREVHEHVETEDRLLNVFGMSRSELVALIQTCRNTNSNQPLDDAILRHLSERTKRGLIKAARQLREAHDATIASLRRLFPALSHTELEVCHQVTLGKTQNEIAAIMGKSATNVSTVRGNIRRKLGLTTDIDLRQYLTEAIASEKDGAAS